MDSLRNFSTSCEVCAGTHPTSTHVHNTEKEKQVQKSLDTIFSDMTGLFPYKKDAALPPGYEVIINYGEPVGLRNPGKVEKMNRTIGALRSQIESEFPNTQLLTERIAKGRGTSGELIPVLQERAKLNGTILSNAEWNKSKSLKLYCGSKADQAEKLYLFASSLRGEAVDPENALQEAKEALRGKKILILGADIGILVEVLKSFGAEAVGIENDEFSVKLAHSGIFAEDFQPQNQVLQGDVWDIGKADSALFKLLKEKGPFDIIYSEAFLNAGSGFWEGNREPLRNIAKFNFGLEELLNASGVQIHSRIDSDHQYDRVRLLLDDVSFRKPNAKKQESDSENMLYGELEKIENNLRHNYTYQKHNSTEVPWVFNSLVITRGHVITETENALNKMAI